MRRTLVSEGRGGTDYEGSQDGTWKWLRDTYFKYQLGAILSHGDVPSDIVYSKASSVDIAKAIVARCEAENTMHKIKTVICDDVNRNWKETACFIFLK